jgi:hypothetical protein
MLRNPRLVGDRAYKGQVVARDCWPAILDLPRPDPPDTTEPAPGLTGSRALSGPAEFEAQ